MLDSFKLHSTTLLKQRYEPGGKGVSVFVLGWTNSGVHDRIIKSI